MNVNVSRVSSGWEFSEQAWVVSLLNTGSVLTGHAVIVVEGIENNTVFVGQYEVSSKIIVDQTVGDVMQRTMGNAQGYIAEIRVIENVGKYTRNYEGYTHKSWYATPENVRIMIDSVKGASEAIKYAIESGEDLPYKYQTAGSSRFWLLGGNGGESCVTWAENQLKLAQIGNGTIWADLVKAFPEWHAEGCVVS